MTLAQLAATYRARAAAFPQALDDGLAEVAANVKTQAEEDWPSPAHPENIWATGRSVLQFKIAKPRPLLRIVFNDAVYSYYAERGFTRWKGEGSARPYRQRGASPYMGQSHALLRADDIWRPVIVSIRIAWRASGG